MKGFGKKTNPRDVNKNRKNYQELLDKALNSHKEGNIIEASKYYQKLLDMGINDSRIFINYGLINRQAGKIKIAKELYLKSIKLFPKEVDAYTNLSYLFTSIKEFNKAKDYANEALKIKSDSIPAYLNLAETYKKLGQINESESVLKKAINVNPKSFEAYLNLSSLLLDQYRLDEAIESTHKAITLEPKSALGYANLGLINYSKNNNESADFFIEKALKLDPNLALAHNIKGGILTNLYKYKEAEKAIRKAININPSFVDGFSNLSKIFHESGRNDLAKHEAEHAIRLDPKKGFPYYILSTFNAVSNLTAYKDYLFSSEIIKNNSFMNQIDILFAKANYLDDKKEFYEAGENYKAANNLNQKIFKSNYQDFTYKMDKYFNLWPKLKEIPTTNLELPTSIFIVGLPRSGKTIVESIFACNNLVHLSRENQFLALSIEKFLSSNDSMSLYEIYIKNFENHIKRENYICSTTPANFLYTGIIASQFPNAKIIYCHRNILDTTIEMYKQNLKGKYSFKNSLIDSSNLSLKIDSLMNKYRDLFKYNIYFLNYDKLVTNTNEEIQSLIEWMGWKYTNKFLTPKLDCSTNSNGTAVDKIINQNHLNLWRNYEKVLEPTLKIMKINSKNKNS